MASISKIRDSLQQQAWLFPFYGAAGLRVLRGRLLAGLTLTFLLLCCRTYAQEPLTLEKCIDIALRQSPTLAISQKQVNQAQGQYQTARAALFPKVDATSYYNRLDPNRLNPIGALTTRPTLFSTESFAGLAGSQLLFDGGKTAALRRAASWGVQGQQAGVRSSQADTVYGVTQAFSNLLVAKALIGVAQQVRKQQQDFVSLTKAFYTAGKVTNLDVLTAEAQELGAEQNLEDAVQNQKVAAVLLQQAMGVQPQDGFDIAGELPQTVAIPLPEEDLVNAAERENPDIQKLRNQVRQAEETLRGSRRSYAPVASLMGTYDYREYNVGGHAFEYTAGVNVSIPVFDSGAIRGQIKTARAVLEQQHESLRAIDIQVKADVRQAMAAWQRAAANVRSGIQLVEAGHESVNTALGLYEAGKATSLDVLTAQSQLALAQSSLLQTRGAYAIAKAQMVRLTGLRDVTTP